MLFFGRLRRWWSNRSRMLFSFHDGTAWRRTDPMRVADALERVCPTYQEHLDTLASDPKETPVGALRDDLVKKQKESVAILIVAARSVFDLKTLTDTAGLSDAEALGVLTSYFVFMEDLADQARVFGNSPAVE